MLNLFDIKLLLCIYIYIFICHSIYLYIYGHVYPSMHSLQKCVKWWNLLNGQVQKKVLCYTLHGVGNQRYGGSLALPHDLFVNNHYFCKCRFSEVSLCEWQCILFFTWYLQQLLLSYIEIIMISVSSIYSLSKSYSDCHAG